MMPNPITAYHYSILYSSVSTCHILWQANRTSTFPGRYGRIVGDACAEAVVPGHHLPATWLNASVGSLSPENRALIPPAGFRHQVLCDLDRRFDGSPPVQNASRYPEHKDGGRVPVSLRNASLGCQPGFQRISMLMSDPGVEKGGFSQRAIAARIGRSQPTVSCGVSHNADKRGSVP